MDLHEAIEALRQERARLERVIAALEAVQKTAEILPTTLPASARRGRRGRTNMPDQERAQVSERMKKYWANRRKAQEVTVPFD